jgi:hypothetical protein
MFVAGGDPRLSAAKVAQPFADTAKRCGTQRQHQLQTQNR